MSVQFTSLLARLRPFRSTLWMTAGFLAMVLGKDLLIQLLVSGTWYKSLLIELTELLVLVFITLAVIFLSRHLPRLSRIVIPLGMTVVLLLAVEVVFGVLLITSKISWSEPSTADGPAPPPPFREEAPDPKTWLEKDPWLGLRAIPKAQVTVKTYTHGKPNPEATYRFDAFGRRDHPRDTLASRTNYTLFFGCSITFGSYVPSGESLPAHFQALDSTAQAYNYGLPGQGAQYPLAQLQAPGFRAQVPEQQGVAIYTYFEGHLARTIGDMQLSTTWAQDMPHYQVRNDSVLRQGDFRTGRPVVQGWYDFLAERFFVRYLHLNFPSRIREPHYEKVARIIKEAAHEYEQQFGNDRFYVVLLPGWDNSIQPYLEALNLRILDCTGLVEDYWVDAYRFEGDGHPTPQFYQLLAAEIHRQLQADPS